MFEAKALFQMKFYALVIWKTRGVVPAMLQLVYLGNAQILRYVPDERDLLATQRKVEAIWQAIRLAEESGRLAPQPGPALLLVRPPGRLPGLRRHPPPLPERAEAVDLEVAICRLTPGPAVGHQPQNRREICGW